MIGDVGAGQAQSVRHVGWERWAFDQGKEQPTAGGVPERKTNTLECGGIDDHTGGGGAIWHRVILQAGLY